MAFLLLDLYGTYADTSYIATILTYGNTDMNTANQVKEMTSSLSRVNANLCACVGLHELLPVQASAEKRIAEAQQMKSRSKKANAELFHAITNATQWLARSQVSSELKRKRAHLS